MNRASANPRTGIETDQLIRLNRLIVQLASNPFYAPRLGKAGLDDGVLSLDAFTRRMPVTTKAELVADQVEHPPYGSNLTYPMERYTRFHQTSGTTGVPLRWLDTPKSWSGLLECWRTVFRSAGVSRGDRVCFAFSFGPFLGFWTAFEAAAELGCLCLPAGGMSSSARLKLILDNQAEVLCCTPTYAVHLAQTARAEGIDPKAFNVKTVIVAGEPGGSLPAVRQQIANGWNGARVFDHHGMTEVGPVTFEHPTRPGLLRVIEAAYLAEIVDPDTLLPAEPGHSGELILTTLERWGMPLLRYRTGDLVRAVYVDDDGNPGPHLSLDGGILGRCDDMVVVRGVNVYPGAIDQILRDRGGVAEYRVTVTEQPAMCELSIEIESTLGAPEDLAARIENDLRQALSLRIPVVQVAPNTLPRFEMKAKRWVRPTSNG